MFNPETGPQEPEVKFVKIDEEHQAMETNELALQGISFENGDPLQFTEIYFETSSNNIYAIAKIKERPENPAPTKWGLINGKKNLGKGKKMTAKELSKDDMEKGILRVGESFRYGNGGATTEIIKILCVDNRTIRANLEGLENIKGSEKDLQSKFQEIVENKK